MSLHDVNKKLDTLIDKQEAMNITMKVMEVDLKYHIKRTDVLEAKLLPIWKVYVAVVIITPFVGGILLFKKQLLELLGIL